MKNFLQIVFIILLLLQGCATWKTSLSPQGDYDSAIKNAISDFSNTTSLFREDRTFSVGIKNLNNGIIGISILGNVNKFIITEDGKSSRLPTKYLEYKGKLFYWYDESYPLNKDIIDKLDKCNLIDSVKSIAFAKLINDDAKKGMDYYFCKNNLLKYKKIKTNQAIGYYEPPKLDCK
jgi:hypothetical protein